MAPNEAAILQNYLLPPARLPAIVSLQDFASYFPKSQQSSPHIRALYRDLQQQRNAVVDVVTNNIDSEVKRGKTLRRGVAKARREAEPDDGIDDEIEIEKNVSPVLGPLLLSCACPAPVTMRRDVLTLRFC